MVAPDLARDSFTRQSIVLAARWGGIDSSGKLSAYPLANELVGVLALFDRAPATTTN